MTRMKPAKAIDFAISGDGTNIHLTVTHDSGMVSQWFDLSFNDLKQLLVDYGFRTTTNPVEDRHRHTY